MFAACDASSADKEGVAIVQEAYMVAGLLTWPDGITSDQKATALKQLKAKGIVPVQEV